MKVELFGERVNIVEGEGYRFVDFGMGKRMVVLVLRMGLRVECENMVLC